MICDFFSALAVPVIARSWESNFYEFWNGWNSMQGTDSGVDTYFGLCTYPGRELRHRIDLKVHGGFQYASSVMLLLKIRDSILVLLLYVVITLTIMIFFSYCCNKQTLFWYCCWHWMVNSQAWHYQFLDYKMTYCVSTGVPEEQICMWSACMDWKWCTKSAV